MKKATYAFLAVFVLGMGISTAAGQGIQSPMVNLPLNGKWQPAVDVEKDSAPGSQVFYDQVSGTVLEMRYDYQLRAVGDISQQFLNAGKSTASADCSKILMSSMFPLPNKYTQSIADSMYQGKTPKLWEVKDPGNVAWFYVSQLFGGYHVTGTDRSTEIHEEFVPLRVIRAEHKATANGDALLFEAETERSAPEIAIRRFKLPATVKDQRLRYGWIQFSPGGMTSSENIISLAFATPVNSGLDVNTVLEQLVGNYKKVEAKN